MYCPKKNPYYGRIWLETKVTIYKMIVELILCNLLNKDKKQIEAVKMDYKKWRVEYQAYNTYQMKKSNDEQGMLIK